MSLKCAVKFLRDVGILIVVDDVGFGRTFLEILLVVEPDVIKIDRSYIDGVANDRVRVHYLERMVQVMSVFGAEFVAEGVERREDLDFFFKLQFFFLCRVICGGILFDRCCSALVPFMGAMTGEFC